MDFFSWILINVKWIVLFFVALLLLVTGFFQYGSWFGGLLILFLLWGWMSFGEG